MSNSTGTITVNTDFDEFLKRTADEWGGYGIAGGMKPNTIEELICARLLEHFAHQIEHSEAWTSMWRELQKRVDAVRDEYVDKAVREAVEKVVQKPVQLTNSYGRPEGPPKTLDDFLLDRMQEQLKATTSGRGSTAMDDALRSVGRAAVAEALKPEIAEATAKLKKTMTEHGATIVKETAERLNAGRVG